MDAALRLPGISNAWTMPIKGRLDMLSTGIRTPIGIKIAGADLEEIQKVAVAVEAALSKVPGTRSVYAERVSEGFFLDFSSSVTSSPVTASASTMPTPWSSPQSAARSRA
jgi:Cu(I)/Ag(I) efflux system membrane protein CusA/SilA